jgi:hypothetical protein
MEKSLGAAIREIEGENKPGTPCYAVNSIATVERNISDECVVYRCQISGTEMMSCCF